MFFHKNVHKAGDFTRYLSCPVGIFFFILHNRSQLRFFFVFTISMQNPCGTFLH